MHELSVIKALLDSVKQYKAEQIQQQVKSIRIEVGEMSCVDPDRLQFCFDMVREEAGMNEAALNIDSVKATAKCNACGNRFELSRIGEPCPCGSYEHDMLSGNELNLTEIEFV